MTGRQPTPEQMEAALANVRAGRNPGAFPETSKPAGGTHRSADLIVRAEVLLDRIERVIVRIENR